MPYPSTSKLVREIGSLDWNLVVMLTRNYGWFLGFSLLIIFTVWSSLDSFEFNKLANNWSSDIGGSALSVESATFFLLMWSLSIWGRCLRYQFLGRLSGVNIKTRDAFESVTLGRFFTLITPTAFFGGQPVSYFRLATRYPTRVAAGVVTVATWLDIAFFMVTTPIVVWRVIFVTQLEHQYTTILLLTLLVYTLIIGATFLALSKFSKIFINLAARFWSTLIPFWQKETLLRTFTHVTQSLQMFVDSLCSGRRDAWFAVACTGVAISFPYVGIWWLLFSMGCSLNIFESIGNQLAINFMALVFSPGAGSGTSEFMFIKMFDIWIGQPALIHLFIFMFASYWSYIFLGLGVWFNWRIDGTLFSLEIAPQFLMENKGVLEVWIRSESDQDRRYVGSVDSAGEFSLFLPKRGNYFWYVENADGVNLVGSIDQSKLIKRVFVGIQKNH